MSTLSQFVNAVVVNASSDSDKWQFGGKIWRDNGGLTRSASYKDNGNLDHKVAMEQYDTLASEENIESPEARRQYQQYLSPLVKVKEIFEKNRSVSWVENAGKPSETTITVCVSDLFLPDGTLAPKTLFNKVIAQFKEGESPTKAFERGMELAIAKLEEALADNPQLVEGKVVELTDLLASILGKK